MLEPKIKEIPSRTWSKQWKWNASKASQPILAESLEPRLPRMWIAEELEYVSLGDNRLNQRLNQIVEELSGNPESSIPQATGHCASIKGTYRFFDNDNVYPGDIMSGHQKKVRERCEKEALILAIQDTTELDYTAHPSTEGLGYLESEKQRGIKVHSTLAVNEKGVPLGIIQQQTWTRADEEYGKKEERHKKPTAEKESQKWLDGEKATLELLENVPKVVTIADREADIYDFFAQPREEGQEFIIRAVQNRRVADGTQQLNQALVEQEPVATIEIKIGRRHGEAPRIATLDVRYREIAIQPPKNRLKSENLQPVRLFALLANEISPPKGVQPVKWLLLTTLPVITLESALLYLKWYSWRWLIERYHYVLKSGCTVEKLQLRTVERLTRAFAVYSMVAWRLLWLTYEVRAHPNQPCTVVLEDYEWQALYGFINKTTTPPPTPPTLEEAVRWIAKLGGFLNRKNDGFPGVKVLWRGMTRLRDIANMWILLHYSS